MYITEYDEEQALAQQRNDGDNVGVEEGKILTFNSIVQDGTITIEKNINGLTSPSNYDKI